jgi:hypothetical protein
MGVAPKSGHYVTKADVPIILAMVARGDRRHDVAAWFGLNQGRIKEVEDGKHGTPPLATQGLPPSGSPGPKARAIRAAVDQAYAELKQGPSGIANAVARLERAMKDFDKNE